MAQPRRRSARIAGRAPSSPPPQAAAAPQVLSSKALTPVPPYPETRDASAAPSSPPADAPPSGAGGGTASATACPIPSSAPASADSDADASRALAIKAGGSGAASPRGGGEPEGPLAALRCDGAAALAAGEYEAAAEIYSDGLDLLASQMAVRFV